MLGAGECNINEALLVGYLRGTRVAKELENSCVWMHTLNDVMIELEQNHYIRFEAFGLVHRHTANLFCKIYIRHNSLANRKLAQSLEENFERNAIK